MKPQKNANPLRAFNASFPRAKFACVKGYGFYRVRVKLDVARVDGDRSTAIPNRMKLITQIEAYKIEFGVCDVDGIDKLADCHPRKS